uniref:Toll-like receptor 4b, duplicate a n=1 Tax=Cyprinus carpio TaxID=7962 RepID=A0A8C1Z146_CYPCA
MSLPPFMSTFKDFSLLDLHANNISIIKTDHTAVLREIDRNMTLILSLNLLLYIKPGAFKDIYLRTGHLICLCFIYTDFLDGLCSISRRYIITLWKILGICTFTEIKELYLVSIKLSTLPGKQLSHLHTLEKLLITHNSAPIWVDAFIDMPKFQYLDLNFSRITFKHCCTTLLTGTPQIRYLNFSRNAETGLDVGGCNGLDSLEIFDFHHTTVVRVGYLSVLSNLKYLKYLDVSYSRITFTKISSFYGLKNLNVLKITYFLSLPSLKQLRSLYVDKNSITSVPLRDLQNLPANLSEFDLSSNPIDCSCSQTDFISWIIQNQNILKQPDNIFCKTFSPSSDFRATDFDTDSCVHKKRLSIVLSVLFLVYRFQFHLQYCCILLRGYRTPAQQECSYDAFVIFSSYDGVWVMNELMENLENGVPPIQLCLHMRDFQAGKSIASNIIDEGIMGSRKIIVVVSQHFIDSAWCRFEFELAQSRFMMERSANIIIIILEDVEERKTKKVFGLHKHLKKITYLKWSRGHLSKMRFWIRLRKAIIATNQKFLIIYWKTDSPFNSYSAVFQSFYIS